MSDMSLFTLERTMETQSFQFLQCVYGRLFFTHFVTYRCSRHVKTLVDPQTKSIAFDQLLDPKTISRRVAATGFYHVLGRFMLFREVIRIPDITSSSCDKTPYASPSGRAVRPN